MKVVRKRGDFNFGRRSVVFEWLNGVFWFQRRARVLGEGFFFWCFASVEGFKGAFELELLTPGLYFIRVYVDEGLTVGLVRRRGRSDGHWSSSKGWGSRLAGDGSRVLASVVPSYCLAMVMGFRCQGYRCELVMGEHRVSASAGMVSGLVIVRGSRGSF